MTNGYPNHETRSLALYLDNEEVFYNLVEKLKESSSDEAELSNYLRAYFYELQSECLKNPTKELMKFFFYIGSLDCVDFNFLAKEYF